ncbi:MAG: tetratricopeptide repeat protein [Planctomycetes bacterium]|nr:tetratricopeptide repeat protein [Planctomycetota bacterium]
MKARRPAPFAAMLLFLAACTSVTTNPNDPLDAGEWRTTKSRMYQDLALQCLQAQDHDRARSLLQQAAQFDPGERRTLELLARLAYVCGDHATARTAAMNLQQLDPDSVAAACTLGALAESSDRPAEAEACYRKALACGPDEVRPGVDLHRLLLAQGRESEAGALRATLQARFPRALEATLDHGASLAATGRWAAAASAYDQALAVVPDDPTAASGFALAAVLAATPKRALELGERLPPRARADNPALALTLATAHLQCGEPELALRELDLALPGSRTAPSLRLLRAEILVRLGQHEHAVAEFERVLLQRPDEVRASAGLGRLHLAAGRAHAAVRCFEDASRLQPANPVHHALLAKALLDAGDPTRARQHVRIAAGTAAGKPLADELLARHPELGPPPGASR